MTSSVWGISWPRRLGIGVGGSYGWGEFHESGGVGAGRGTRMLLRFREEQSGRLGRNEEQRCNEAAPRRMKMASRGETVRKHERRERCMVKKRSEGARADDSEGALLRHPSE